MTPVDEIRRAALLMRDNHPDEPFMVAVADLLDGIVHATPLPPLDEYVPEPVLALRVARAYLGGAT